MKVLSVCQPWASLIVMGHKAIENRSWATALRGRIAIHASASKPDDRFLEEMPLFCELFRLPALDLEALSRGAILGTVEIVDCRRFEDLPRRWRDHPFAQPRCWCWQLANARLLSAPVPCKGALRLWDAPPDLRLV